MEFLRKHWVWILAVALVFSCAKQGTKQVELKTLEDKFSYTVGYQFGSQFKEGGYAYNIDAVVMGIEDVNKGNPLKLTMGQMDSAMGATNAVIATKRQQEAEANLVKVKEYLDQNAKKEGIKTLASGLQYKILQEGTGAKPTSMDTVRVHYRGTFMDGKEFDNSYTRGEPAVFLIENVIPGWKEAIPLMKVGSKWQLFVSPDLGYGPNGYGNIPGNALLIFEVELLEIVKNK